MQKAINVYAYFGPEIYLITNIMAFSFMFLMGDNKKQLLLGIVQNTSFQFAMRNLD